jgi:hypothetical protein
MQAAVRDADEQLAHVQYGILELNRMATMLKEEQTTMTNQKALLEKTPEETPEETPEIVTIVNAQLKMVTDQLDDLNGLIDNLHLQHITMGCQRASMARALLKEQEKEQENVNAVLDVQGRMCGGGTGVVYVVADHSEDENDEDEEDKEDDEDEGIEVD